jgi:4-diphosphocytidyl-2-C-methyl-D-erythritol kinase
MGATLREARVLAQAKINVFLRVLARAVDGYHSIETLFLRLDLGDAVRVQVGGAERTLRAQGPMCPAGGLGPPEQNLAYRAAAAYAEAAGWPKGFTIHIDKQIPVGGGLGGGSADAGAVLRALDALARQPVGAQLLQQVAVRIGADVPFLTSESPCALAWGRGERLLDVAPPPPRRVELLVPSFPISTKAAYDEFAASRERYQPCAAHLNPRDLSSWDRLAAIAINDLEPTVAARHREIFDCVATLRAWGARIALMTGSGSTVFGIFDGEPTSVADAPRPSVARLGTRTAQRVAAVELID